MLSTFQGMLRVPDRVLIWAVLRKTGPRRRRMSAADPALVCMSLFLISSSIVLTSNYFVIDTALISIRLVRLPQEVVALVSIEGLAKAARETFGYAVQGRLQRFQTCRV